MATTTVHQPVRAGPRRSPDPPREEVTPLAWEPPRAPRELPPTLLRQALEQRRRAGFPWNDQAFTWLVGEVTRPLQDADWRRFAFWREVLLDHIELWRLGYERRGPGQHSLTIFLAD